MALANTLKSSTGGRFLGRFGQVDTKTPLLAGNFDADRPRDMTGVKQSAAATANNVAAAVEDTAKAVVAPFTTAFEYAAKGGAAFARFLGFKKPGIITGTLGTIGGFLYGAVTGVTKGLMHQAHATADTAQAVVAAGETVVDAANAGLDWLCGC